MAFQTILAKVAIFLIPFFPYIYSYRIKETQQIIEKLVTEMEPFEFASSPRKPHLSISMRLEVIQKRVKGYRLKTVQKWQKRN